MRTAIVGALFACLFAPEAFAVPAVPAAIPADPVVMPDTPSGTGDPNTMVCRASQRISDGDQLGPKICGYNHEWWQLTAHGKDLAPDGTVIDRPMEWSPKGHGNPDAVTCRKPKSLPEPGFNLGPEVCQTNRFWADLIKNHKIVDARGEVSAVSLGMPAYEGTGYVDPLAGYRMGGP
jgi:hypothetical protein